MRDDRARHRPPPHPRRRQRPDAGDAAGVAGPDDRLDRAADDRRRARRARAPLVGGDRLPAGGDGGDAAVRQARRPLRAQDRAAGRADPVPHRLRAVRARAGHDRADRVPRHPGPGRRRTDGERAGGDRRRRAAERPRPLHGAVRRGVRRLERRRPADRRLPHHAPVVALDLLRQPAAGCRRARRARGHAAIGDGAAPARDRLRRHAAAGGRAERDHPAHLAGREHLRLGLAADRGPGRDRGRVPRRVRVRRAARGRADPAAVAVPQPRVPDDERGRADRRLRAVRRADLPAAVPADRARAVSDRVRAAAAAGDGRAADLLDRLRADHLARRPLQVLPDRRHGGGRLRDVPAVLARARPPATGRGRAAHAGARPRARDGHAGARARGPERGAVRDARRGHLGRDAVPLDRRLARRRGARRDLHRPPDAASCRPARRRAVGSTRRRSTGCRPRSATSSSTPSPTRCSSSSRWPPSSCSSPSSCRG